MFDIINRNLNAGHFACTVHISEIYGSQISHCSVNESYFYPGIPKGLPRVQGLTGAPNQQGNGHILPEQNT